MRKFGGKCFIYKARGDKSVIHTTVHLGGDDGFDTGKNKMSCRRNEPNVAMVNRETNHWSITRGADEPGCRLTNTSIGMMRMSRDDTIRRRRDNENYDQ